MSNFDQNEKRDDLTKLNDMYSNLGGDKKSEKRMVSESRLNQIMTFREQFLNNQLKRLTEKSFIQFNVRLLLKYIRARLSRNVGIFALVLKIISSPEKKKFA